MPVHYSALPFLQLRPSFGPGRHGFSRVLRIGLLLGASLSVTWSSAQTLNTGEQKYKENCLACHATKFDRAPQFGDRNAWKHLDAEGQHVVTAHGWVGVRNMPPRGGNPDLSLEEFSQANAYMARGAGLDWKDPDQAMISLIREEVAKREAELEAKKKI